MWAVMCGIYIAFPCALAPWTMVIGSSKEERAIKADVCAQKWWKMISHLGDTCALCPSCSKYLLFICCPAFCWSAPCCWGHENLGWAPSCPGLTPPSPVWLQSSALLSSPPQPRHSITDPPVPPALPLLEIVSGCPFCKAWDNLLPCNGSVMEWQLWEAEMSPKSLWLWVTSPSHSLRSSLSLWSLWHLPLMVP